MKSILNYKELESLWHRRESEFFALMENKSIAIVGRANYLATIEQREKIEAHDVVIRIHGPFTHKPYIHDFQGDAAPYIGKRVDVYASRLWKKSHKRLIEMHDDFKRSGGTFVFVDSFFEFQRAVAAWLILEKRGIPVHIAPLSFYTWLSMQLDYAIPLPGTIVAAYIAETRARSIYITGCACYQESPGASTRAALESKHSCYSDSHFLRHLINRDSRFRCDAVMTANLGKPKFQQITAESNRTEYHH